MRDEDLIVVFPLDIPLPSGLIRECKRILAALHVLSKDDKPHVVSAADSKSSRPTLHVDFVLAPFIAVLFLLATSCIGGTQLRDGIIGSNR
jgi:hypothetical protein